MAFDDFHGIYEPAKCVYIYIYSAVALFHVSNSSSIAIEEH